MRVRQCDPLGIGSSWAAALVALLVCVVAVFDFTEGAPAIRYRIDLDVYRLGAQALLSGQDLYGPMPPTATGLGLPFTYPPIAAAAFVPLALVPYWLANVVVTLVSLASLWLGLTCILRVLIPARRTGIAALWLATALALFEPVRTTIALGQVNLVLFMLVIVDLTLLPRRWRGVLIGVAASVKLTPIVFVGYYLIRRDWPSMARAAASVAFFTGLGFILAPRDSATYWTETLLSPERIGGLNYVSNQSFRGAWGRLLGSVETIPWLVLVGSLGLFVLHLLHILLSRGRELEAITLLALYMLLVSPVSWSHHWVWIAVGLVVVAGWREPPLRRWRWALMLSGVIIFLPGLVYAMPNEKERELGWAWWQHLVGNAYLLWGLVYICALRVLATVLPKRLRRAESERDVWQP